MRSLAPVASFAKFNIALFAKLRVLTLLLQGHFATLEQLELSAKSQSHFSAATMRRVELQIATATANLT